MQVTCSHCGSPIEVRDIAQPEIFNSPTTSAIILAHPKHAFCLGCKNQVAVVIQGANLHLGTAPIKPASPIVVPNGMPKIVKG